MRSLPDRVHARRCQPGHARSPHSASFSGRCANNADGPVKSGPASQASHAGWLARIVRMAEKNRWQGRKVDDDMHAPSLRAIMKHVLPQSGRRKGARPPTPRTPLPSR